MSTSSELANFQTNRSTKVTLAICLWWAIPAGIGAAFEGAWIEGPLFAAAFAGMWLWYATLAVHIGPAKVVARRAGLIVWSADRKSIHATFGFGGGMQTHTALILESPETRKPLQLLKVNFGVDQLQEMAGKLGVKHKVPGGIF